MNTLTSDVQSPSIVRTVVTDCQDCEKSTWGFGHAERSIGINHQILPVSVPQKGSVARQGFDVLPRPSVNGIVAK